MLKPGLEVASLKHTQGWGPVRRKAPTWDLMFCGHLLEILNSFIFEFMFYKWSLMWQWTLHLGQPQESVAHSQSPGLPPPRGEFLAHGPPAPALPGFLPSTLWPGLHCPQAGASEKPGMNPWHLSTWASLPHTAASMAGDWFRLNQASYPCPFPSPPINQTREHDPVQSFKDPRGDPSGAGWSSEPMGRGSAWIHSPRHHCLSGASTWWEGETLGSSHGMQAPCFSIYIGHL